MCVFDGERNTNFIDSLWSSRPEIFLTSQVKISALRPAAFADTYRDFGKSFIKNQLLSVFCTVHFDFVQIENVFVDDVIVTYLSGLDHIDDHFSTIQPKSKQYYNSFYQVA